MESKYQTLQNHGTGCKKNYKKKILAIFEGDDRESIVPLLKEQYKILYGSSNDIIQK